tara:strand:+ start:864 stop:1433 length:570 start_codon:yes stop_codon:yes gene_type:complete
MAKKVSHTQKLMDSMRTLGTAKTPISNAYESGKDRNILPKGIKAKSKGRGIAERILVPTKLNKISRPTAVADPGTGKDGITPSASYQRTNRLTSFGLKGWDTRARNYTAERAAYNLASRNYTTYARNLDASIESEKKSNTRDKEIGVAQQNKSLEILASTNRGARKAMSRAKGSRGGLGRSGGLRGGSR